MGNVYIQSQLQAKDGEPFNRFITSISPCEKETMIELGNMATELQPRDWPLLPILIPGIPYIPDNLRGIIINSFNDEFRNNERDRVEAIASAQGRFQELQESIENVICATTEYENLLAVQLLFLPAKEMDKVLNKVVQQKEKSMLKQIIDIGEGKTSTMKSQAVKEIVAEMGIEFKEAEKVFRERLRQNITLEDALQVFSKEQRQQNYVMFWNYLWEIGKIENVSDLIIDRESLTEEYQAFCTELVRRICYRRSRVDEDIFRNAISSKTSKLPFLSIIRNSADLEETQKCEEIIGGDKISNVRLVTFACLGEFTIDSDNDKPIIRDLDVLSPTLQDVQVTRAITIERLIKLGGKPTEQEIIIADEGLIEVRNRDLLDFEGELETSLRSDFIPRFFGWINEIWFRKSGKNPNIRLLSDLNSLDIQNAPILDENDSRFQAVRQFNLSVCNKLYPGDFQNEAKATAITKYEVVTYYQQMAKLLSTLKDGEAIIILDNEFVDDLSWELSAMRRDLFKRAIPEELKNRIGFLPIA